MVDKANEVELVKASAITDAQAILLHLMGGTLKGWYLKGTAMAYLHNAYYHLQDQLTPRDNYPQWPIL